MMDFLHVKWCLIALLAIAAIAAPAHAQIFPNKTIAEPPNSRSPTGTNVPAGGAGVGAIALAFAMLVKRKTRFTH